jgi:Domain of unknown function (DUF1996)
MAFPSEVDDGFCPPSHPIHLISLFYEVWFNVAQFNGLNDGGRFVLANGDPTGYGLHGDFMNGWDRNVLSDAVKRCTDSSGNIQNCPTFQGRFYSDAEMNACSAPNPIPAESVPGAVYPNLPGCVAVTNGPGAASPHDLVPGCKAPTSRRSEPWCDEDEEPAPAAVPETSVDRRRSRRAMRREGSLASM